MFFLSLSNDSVVTTMLSPLPARDDAVSLMILKTPTTKTPRATAPHPGLEGLGVRLVARRVEALRERGALVALRGLDALLAEAVEEVVLRRAFRAARAVVVLAPVGIAEDVVGLGQQTKTFLVAAAVGVLLEGLAAEGLAHLGGRGVAGHAEQGVVVGGGHVFRTCVRRCDRAPSRRGGGFSRGARRGLAGASWRGCAPLVLLCVSAVAAGASEGCCS